MPGRRLFALLTGVTLLLSGGGCTELFLSNLFSVSVMPPADGGAAHRVAAGGLVDVTIRVDVGVNVKGEVSMFLRAPAGIQAYFGSTPGSDGWEGEFAEDEDRDVRATVLVAGNVAPGTYTISVAASGTFERTDASADDLDDMGSTTFAVLVIEDTEGPVVTIEQPAAGNVFAVSPVPSRITVTDDARIQNVSYRLNGGQERVVFDFWSNDPARSVTKDVDIAEPVVGGNTLEVTATDAQGHEASTSVSFEYDPVGTCDQLEFAVSPAPLFSPPSGWLETNVTVTPLGGWEGKIGMAIWSAPRIYRSRGSFYPDRSADIVDGPVDFAVRFKLEDGLTPGESRHLIVRAEEIGGTDAIACETAIEVNIIDPASHSLPDLVISNPSTGTVVTDPVIQLSGEARDEGAVTRVSYNLELSAGSEHEIFAGQAESVPINETLTLREGAEVREGVEVIDIWAVDDEGRVAFVKIAVEYDPDGEPNTAPTVTIDNPQEEAQYDVDTPVTFDGSAADAEDGELTGTSLAWVSDLDGPIGTGNTFERSDLSAGLHTVTLTATDSKGTAGTATVTFEIVAQAGHCDNFSVVLTPTSIEAEPGGPGSVGVQIMPVAGFDASVSLSLIGPVPPEEVFSSWAFTPEATTGTESTLDFTLLTGVSVGTTYDFTIVGLSAAPASQCYAVFSVTAVSPPVVFEDTFDDGSAPYTRWTVTVDATSEGVKGKS